MSLRNVSLLSVMSPLTLCPVPSTRRHLRPWFKSCCICAHRKVVEGEGDALVRMLRRWMDLCTQKGSEGGGRCHGADVEKVDASVHTER